MMRTLVTAAVAVLLLGACGFTDKGDAVREFMKAKGAEIADQKLKIDIWGLCQGNTVGAVDRYFGQSTELASSWRQLCHGQDGVSLFDPKEE